MQRCGVSLRHFHFTGFEVDFPHVCAFLAFKDQPVSFPAAVAVVVIEFKTKVSDFHRLIQFIVLKMQAHTLDIDGAPFFDELRCCFAKLGGVDESQ